MTIQRQPLYFPGNDVQLFGWYHSCDAVKPANVVVVVCAPLGYEYTHSHRSLRHLCDQLASVGIPSFRFDFHGAGDSAGGELEPARLLRWQQDVVSAVECARSFSKCEQVCVIGVRLGATLAAMASGLVPMDYLVLWNPIVNGRRYIRELKVTAATTEDNADGASADVLESGGFLITTETERELTALNLLDAHVIPTKSALIVARDDLSFGTELQDALRARFVTVDQVALPGYADMMARLEINKVPHEAIAEIVSWLQKQTSIVFADDLPQPRKFDLPSRILMAHDGGVLTETLCQFGDDQHLFGIFTSADEIPRSRPTVVLLNSGSVHHVGPGRFYVTLARHLARNGFNCFRMDIEGLGDSVLRQEGRENHPYPDHAFDDAATALEYLRNNWQCTRFALAGLCSGGYTAFHSSLRLSNDPSIQHVLSINPLTFHWVEGVTTLLTQSFKEELWAVNHYKSSARDWRRWLKLLSGKADYAYIFKMVFEQASKKAKTVLFALREVMSKEPITMLGQQIDSLLKVNRSLSFIISTSDPGYQLLLRDGGYFVKRLIESKKIAVYHVENSDHTFSRLKPRTLAIDLVTDDLTKVFGKL